MTSAQRLSANARSEIRALSGAEPYRFLYELASAWAVIGIAIGIAIYTDNVVVSAVCIFIVATRQNLLALLVHEQTHSLGLNWKFGDAVANIFTAYPLLAVSVEGYTDIHLRHHRSYFTAEDPDFIRKSGPDWTFPTSIGSLVGLFAQDLTGISFVRFILAHKNKSTDIEASFIRRKNPSPKWLKPVYLLVVATCLTLMHGWAYFVLYWLLPLVTIFPAIVRWGAICEHSYGEEGASVEETSPVILPTLASRIILPNLNFTLHAYHHFFPRVPFANLPKVHEIFVRENLVQADQVFLGHADYLRYILGQPRAVRAIQRFEETSSSAM